MLVKLPAVVQKFVVRIKCRLGNVLVTVRKDEELMNRTLAAPSDTQLPRVMSGEFWVRTACELFEEVV